MIDNHTVCAIIPLHYGKNYLAYAMHSVLDVVDEFLVMYSHRPNHGAHASPLPCPDTRDELFDLAFSVAPDITRWFEYDGWVNEGAQFSGEWHRTDADVILKLDADEIWSPGLLAAAVRQGIREQVREVRVPLVHYWRSFYRGFTQDPAAPGRLYFRRIPAGEATHWDGRIQHMGYAETLDTVRYKMTIHGHKAQFTNPHWFDEVYAANRQTDCHPVGSQYWLTVEDITPPAFLLDHPFAALDLIE